MKRIINFRSFIYSTILLMLVILSCLVALNIPALGFIFIIILIFAPLIIAFIIKKRLETYILVTVVLTALLCFVSMICFFIKAYTWIPFEIENKTYSVEGIIEDNYVLDDNRIVILKDLSFDGNEVEGRMQVYVNDEEKFFHLVPVGDKLKFFAYIRCKDLISDFEVKANYLRSDIRYSTEIMAKNVEISEGKIGFMDKVNLYVKDTLIDCMGNKYGVIAYGILTGDKNEISSDVRDSFSAAGMAHILAVSGLHIGVLMAIVAFVLRKLKVKKILTFIISGTVLVLYCLFAGFSPSVVRAAIMFFVGSGAMLLGEQKDSLNSLGVASTVLLTASPIMLFEAGFVMSVGAVFGLIVFTPMLTRVMTKIKLPEKLANTIAVPVAAQLGVLPSNIFFFESVQLYSIIINIVLMPLMSFTFIAVFAALLLSLIPPLKFVVTLSGFLIKGLSIAADFCASLPLSQLSVKASLIAFAAFPVYFLMGDFVNCKRKGIVISICAVLIVMTVILLALV